MWGVGVSSGVGLGCSIEVQKLKISICETQRMIVLTGVFFCQNIRGLYSLNIYFIVISINIYFIVSMISKCQVSF